MPGLDARAELIRDAAAVGALLSESQAERMLVLVELILQAPFNLTAIRDPAVARQKHLVDSLGLLPWIGPGPGRLADLGSGAGLPGIPLGVSRPDLDVFLVESVHKKAAFLERAVDELGLGNVRVVTARAEDLGQDPAWRESLDWVVARAVAPLRVLVEYALPLCRVGGRLVAAKGPGVGEEVSAAGRAIQLLGGRWGPVTAVQIPGLGEQRTVACVDKVRPTPARWPRRAGTPARRPL